MIPSVTGATGGQVGLPYQWVTAGNSGFLYTSSSTTLGTGTWTSRTSSFGTTNISRVASNGTNLYVAVGNSGKLASSPDGVTWTQRTTGFGTTLIADVAYGGGYWVAVSALHNTVYKGAYSTDGINWTDLILPSIGDPILVSYGNGLWVVADGSGNFITATNPTGTWTSRTSTLGTPDAIHYFKGGSIWVAGFDSGTTGSMAYSTDGLTWTASTSAISVSGTGGAFASNNAVVTACVPTATGSDVESSTNGTSWTDRTPAFSTLVAMDGASDDAGLMAFVSRATTNGAQTSSDGVTWTAQNLPYATLNTICHSSGTPSIR